MKSKTQSRIENHIHRVNNALSNRTRSIQILTTFVLAARLTSSTHDIVVVIHHETSDDGKLHIKCIIVIVVAINGSNYISTVTNNQTK